MKLFALFKKEAVLCIAAICALLTMLAVPPDSAYAGYIDMRMLCLLFSLMAVVALVGRCGAFRFLAVWLLDRVDELCQGVRAGSSSPGGPLIVSTVHAREGL